MKRAVWGAVLGLSCALLGACGDENDEGEKEDPQATNSVELRITLEDSSCGIATAEATVKGPVPSFPGPTIGPVPLSVVDHSIQGTLTDIPVGPQRLVEVSVYDSNGVNTYAGNASVDVYEDRVSIAFIRLSGVYPNCP